MTKTHDDHKNNFIEQFAKSSERGISLAVFAYLESKIDMCYKNIFKDEKSYKSMMKSSLRMTSAKINFLHALGIIDEDSYNDLIILKDIRNKFAHYMDIDSFSNHKISTLMSEIKMSPRTAIYGKGNEHETYHDDFISQQHKDYTYDGFLYIAICRGYAKLFQANCNNLSATLGLDAIGFKDMPAFSGKTAKLLFQIF